MLKRLQKNKIESDLKSFPCVALLGPRQVGKTTLAKQILKGREDALFLDLEKPSDLNKLTDAETYLKSKEALLVCIDEVQLRPDLFPILRALIDENRRASRFLLLGSAAPELLRQSSETLAGRIAYHYIHPFSDLELTGSYDYNMKLWRGGFPDSFLAQSDEVSFRWRENYIQTFLQRDLRQFGIEQSPEKLRRLWIMCAHLHGQLLNYSKLGQSLDQAHSTVNTHIDILESTFMVRRLLPYYLNTKKRLVKTPKIYLRDSGLLCTLLQIPSFEMLYSHPCYGHAWEGFCVENILAVFEPKSLFGFFRLHTGEEIDLVVEGVHKKIGFEFKTSNSPQLSQYNLKAVELLDLDHLYFVTPHIDNYPLKADKVTVIGLRQLLEKSDLFS